MSDLNLENIVGFKAVDKDGNEQNVTVDEMVDMVSTRMVMALSETSTFAAAAATGNDVYENELPTVTDAANVRVLQSSGDAAKMTMQSLASKLGELLGNPKGTKSFSSWSEFTDFVNEMPIKTIQPFVSNFNAFAGEGFYGNVVQGLVIKQLEDVVFIFGIAIDGTLIFRKRNYPDVSTWEDPKIIIHSNNWHKIYLKPDLGELLPIVSENNNGLAWKGGFIERVKITSSMSIDDYTNPGMYGLDGCQDSPYKYGGLIVFKANVLVVQIVYEMQGSNRPKYRQNWANQGWQSWYSF